MTTLETLRGQADDSCSRRGHRMVWEPPICGETMQEAECSVCKAWVQVDTKPLPNGIDIGGPAVALGCPARDVAEELAKMREIARQMFNALGKYASEAEKEAARVAYFDHKDAE